MYRKYTIESDCWSFGILLWEVITYGKQPWFEYSNLEVIQNVTRGKQLSPPDNCPTELTDLMQACWQFNPIDRIPIAKAHVKLMELKKQYQSGQTPPVSATASPVKSITPEAGEITAVKNMAQKENVIPAKPVASHETTPPSTYSTSAEKVDYLELSHG